jgi:hypothetical protein
MLAAWTMKPSEGTVTGRPIATDPDAISASNSLPAFFAKPADAPVYHGFKILTDVVVDGFTLGIITDFEAEPGNEGDAFVIAPDGTRAGLVWSVSDESRFERICHDTDDRWGVWAVSFSLPMSCRNNARSNLGGVVPMLKPK